MGLHPIEVRRIGDWEMSLDAEPTPLERTDGFDTVSAVHSREARQILDLVAPYLATVTEVLAPLLAAHGLSVAEATLEDLLALDGLVDAVVRAATVAVAQVDAIGLHPTDGMGYQAAAGPLPMGWELGQVPGDTVLRGLDVESPPPATQASPIPAGWQVHIEHAPRHLLFDEDGEPCYPDAPPFEDFWPKCPPPETSPAPVDVPCTEDARFVRAEERLRSRRNFGRVPNRFRGFDYREHLEQSVTLPIDELYRCGNHPSSPSTLASWFGPPGPAVIRLYERFLDLESEWDLLGVLTGPVDFRAAVLLHEHVHRIEDPQTGTVAAPSDRDYHPAGSSGQDDCPWSGTEYDAAYLQALFLGGSETIARMVGDLYGRARCGRLSRSAQRLAAAGDLIEVLSLGWLASLDVIAALTVYLLSDTDRGVQLLSQLLTPDIAVLFLFLFLPG